MTQSTTQELNWRLLAAIFSCVTVYGLTHGLISPLLALILESRGTDRTWIGLLAASSAAGMLAIAPCIPFLIARVGIRRFLIGCLLLDTLAMLLFPLFDNLYFWMVLRAAMGASVNGLFVSSETWINEITADHQRGKVMGSYNGVLTAAFATGPVILVLVGSAGWVPFVLGATLLLIAIVPLAWTGESTPNIDGGVSFNALTFVRVSPVLAAAVVLFALMEFLTMGLMPVYGVRSGLDEESAALMLTAIGLGGVVLQLPIGWLADRVDRYRLMWACGACGALGATLLPFVARDHWSFWVLLFFWGGLFAGLYTVAMTIIGSRFRGAELAMATAATGLLWGAASLVGPSITGIAMDVWDPHGFPVVLIIASAAFLAIGWRSAFQRRP